MPYFKSDAGLIIPKRTGKISSHHNISVASVNQWRKKHAHSDITTTAKDLFLMLQDMHQTPMPAKTRFEILLMLKPTLAFLCDGLQKLYYRQEILSENLRAIADLVYALNAEMLNGYKLVIHDTLRPFFTNKNLLVGALANAMHFAIRILFHAFEQHRHPPKDSWQELHALYQFGVKHKLLKRKINHSFSHSRFTHINDMYKHALLFAISNPHRLRKEELAHLIYAMDNWAGMIELKPAKEAKPELFIVDLQSDSGPKYTVLYPEPSDHCFYLDMHSLLEHMALLIDKQQGTQPLKIEQVFSAAEQALPKSFLESLLSSWEQMEERQHQRESAKGFMGVTIGISNCFHFLKKSSTLHTAESTTAKDSITAMPRNESINIEQLPNAKIPEDSHKPLYTCELIDKSERGYCLKWLQEIPPQLICGEILGLETGDQEWEIGTIRWLKHEENNVLLIGIQLLGKQGVALNVRSSTQNNSVQTLLIPSKNPDLPDILITPTVPYKAGQNLTLVYEGQHYEAALEKNKTQTPSFQCFSIAYTSEPIKITQQELPKDKASPY